MKKADFEKKKILVAMSGGLDSSIAAWLLKEKGHDVTGVTMDMGLNGGRGGGREGADAVTKAARVCEHLSIPHITLEVADLFEKRVIGKFAFEYSRGRTPNPCIDCNRYLKFGVLLEETLKMGFDHLATGHYARIDHAEGRWRLLRPLDSAKDQTYFLYRIRRVDLPHLLFPLGSSRKSEVRLMAERLSLPLALNEESQDICFIPDGDYRALLSDLSVCSEPGDIVDVSGRVIGRHRGIVNYTVGQRGGLGISTPRPLHVISIDAMNNRVVVGHKEDLYSRMLIAGDLNLMRETLPERATAKIRYRKRFASCSVERRGDRAVVLFDEPQDSITPGQAVVFYDGAEVLGGGVIERSLP